jgi:hypothetical protein
MTEKMTLTFSPDAFADAIEHLAGNYLAVRLADGRDMVLGVLDNQVAMRDWDKAESIPIGDPVPVEDYAVLDGLYVF